MISVSEHGYEDESDKLRVMIRQVMQEDYGLFIWSCSVVLAEYVWQQRNRFLGCNVLELGAGTALPGIVAAKLGSHVTLTDDCNRTEVLENMTETCKLNNVDCKVIGLTWGEWNRSTFDLHPQIVLGADVLYENKDFDDLLSTVCFFLKNVKDSKFITAYQRRGGHHLLNYLMMKWNLKCIKLIDAFEFLPSDKACLISESVEIAEIQAR